MICCWQCGTTMFYAEDIGLEQTRAPLLLIKGHRPIWLIRYSYSQSNASSVARNYYWILVFWVVYQLIDQTSFLSVFIVTNLLFILFREEGIRSDLTVWCCNWQLYSSCTLLLMMDAFCTAVKTSRGTFSNMLHYIENVVWDLDGVLLRKVIPVRYNSSLVLEIFAPFLWQEQHDLSRAKMFYIDWMINPWTQKGILFEVNQMLCITLPVPLLLYHVVETKMTDFLGSIVNRIVCGNFLYQTRKKIIWVSLEKIYK